MSESLRAAVYMRRRSQPPTAPDAGPRALPSANRSLPRSLWSTLSPLSLLAGVLAFLVLGFSRQPELKVGVPVALLVAAVAWPTLRRLGRGRAFDLPGIALTGLGLKLVGIALRYDVIFGTYEGVADAGIYHDHGARLASAYRELNFDAPAEQKIPGTGFIRVVIGYVYAVVGSHIVVGFIVFGMFGFVGAWLLYRAFETALDDGNHRRYALLVFLWPSLLFWPSSLGKEAWVILGLGVAAYGGARVLARRPGGFVLAAVGMWAITMTRPHITVLLFAAFAGAYFLRPGAPGSSLGPVAKALGIGFLFLVSGTIIAQFEEFFDLDSFDRDSIEETLDETEESTGQGGSKFVPPDPFTPHGFAFSVVTVLFRPFPWEADNLQMLGTSLEGLVLAAFMARSVPRIVRASTRVRRWPYVTQSLSYLLAFSFAFSAIANFGILARQRTQLLPFVFVLVCLPTALGVLGDQRRDREGLRAHRAVVPARRPR